MVEGLGVRLRAADLGLGFRLRAADLGLGLRFLGFRI